MFTAIFIAAVGMLLAGLWLSEGTYWSGVGGVVTFTPDATGIEITTINNTEWSKDEGNRLSEVTNAQSGGQSKFIASVNEEDGTFTVVWNSAAVPSSVGLIQGKPGTLKEYLGASTKYKSQAVMIQKISHKVNAQNGAITYTVSYKGNGVVTNN